MKFPAFDPIDLKNNVRSVSVEDINLSKIYPNLSQPRKNFESIALEELAFSIKQHGVVQPIIVQTKGEDKFEIIAGERRWRASKLAGLKIIPAIIQQNDSQRNIAISLIENIQREELNPIELAQTFLQLNEEQQLSHEAIAKMVGKSRAAITNLLRLLKLDEKVQTLLIDGKLEIGHSRVLLSLPNVEQIKYAYKIIERNLTVREAERLVQLTKKSKKTKLSPYDSKVQGWVNRLSRSLSSKVVVNINEKGEGKVVIHFSSLDEIDLIVGHFTNRKGETP